MKQSKKTEAAYQVRLKDYEGVSSNVKAGFKKPGSRNPKKVK